jgi:hypothetical protein
LKISVSRLLDSSEQRHLLLSCLELKQCVSSLLDWSVSCFLEES